MITIDGKNDTEEKDNAWMDAFVRQLPA